MRMSKSWHVFGTEAQIIFDRVVKLRILVFGSIPNFGDRISEIIPLILQNYGVVFNRCSLAIRSTRWLQRSVFSPA